MQDSSNAVPANVTTMAIHTFRATLGEDRPVVEVPLDVPAAFGRQRAPVKGTVNGTPFRTTIAVYGGRYYIGFNKRLRGAAGISLGEEVEIELERDEDPREVEVPADLTEALRSVPEAEKAFGRLSYTHRKEYVEWITEAKKQETRERRVLKTVERLAWGEEHR
jgi:Bacteriocin-protection, YdeI or OmpD-Associated/Domain of unknown function (DUF1905)